MASGLFSGRSRLRHPVVGELSVDCQALTGIDDQEQAIVLLTAPRGSPDHEATKRLDAWADRQQLQPSHP
ncbi:MmyB family transcriptional regulator [Nonomuraea sp. 3N208]|uniref:MmyB family transcriptional regulator n=1 Tax=Nonomuraea sp. 3N208 TaxID=3457421 RepID=UPI003FD39216